MFPFQHSTKDQTFQDRTDAEKVPNIYLIPAIYLVLVTKDFHISCYVPLTKRSLADFKQYVKAQ